MIPSRAARHTLTFARESSYAPSMGALFDQVLADPERSEDGRGFHHAIWLLKEIALERVIGEKAHRWLAYAQGLLVAQAVLTLNQCRIANLLAKPLDIEFESQSTDS